MLDAATRVLDGADRFPDRRWISAVLVGDAAVRQVFHPNHRFALDKSCRVHGYDVVVFRIYHCLGFGKRSGSWGQASRIEVLGRAVPFEAGIQFQPDFTEVTSAQIAHLPVWQSSRLQVGKIATATVNSSL